MHRVLILGAGKIGALISGLLAESGSYRVQLADVDGAAAESVVRAHGGDHLSAPTPWMRPMRPPSRKHLAEHPVDAVISSLPLLLQRRRSRRRRARPAPTTSTSPRTSRSPARCAPSPSAPAEAFVPQCGLAPGLHQHRRRRARSRTSTQLRAVKLRVGALPQHPNNVLKYSLTWSTEGLINEYGNPVPGGRATARLVEVAPLEGLEEIEIDGTLLRGIQHLGRPRLARRDPRRAHASR